MAMVTLVITSVIIYIIQLLIVERSSRIASDEQLTISTKLIISMYDSTFKTHRVVLTYSNRYILEHLCIRFVMLENVVGMTYTAFETLTAFPTGVYC